MLLVLNMLGFWIHDSFKYVRVTQGSKYAWICLNNSWICLIIRQCVNVPKFVWMAFVLHSPIVIPYLKEPSTVFLESKNLIFSIEVGSIWFSFLFLGWIFLQVKLQLCCCVWGLRGPQGLWSYPTSQVTNKYIYDAFLIIYLFCSFVRL